MGEFIAGMALGVLVGALSTAVCVASGDASRAEEGWVRPVRCRRCAHYDGDYWMCVKWDEPHVPGFYCAGGEEEKESAD
jgi:hypothetical protein